MLKEPESTLVPDKIFEKERNTQYKEGYFVIINGIVHTEDLSVQCTK